MIRFHVAIFKALGTPAALALASVCALLSASPALAQPAGGARPPDLWFAGTRLILDHPQERDGEVAVAVDDAGLDRLLAKLGAAVSYEPGQRYVVVSTPDHRTLDFALGDAHVAVDGRTAEIPFAPYAEGRVAYVPFFALAHALGIAPLRDGDSVVLQPQLEAVDVTQKNGATYLTLRSAAPLVFRRIGDQAPAHVSLALLGVGTSLEAEQSVASDAVAGVSLAAGGTPRNPTVVVTVATATDAVAGITDSASPNALVLAFERAHPPAGLRAIPEQGTSVAFVRVPGSALAAPSAASGDAQPLQRPTLTPSFAPTAAQPEAPNAAAPPPSPAPSDAPPASARVTAVAVTSSLSGAVVHVSVEGETSYEWHRLADNRWYLDLQGALLAAPARDDVVGTDALTELRAKQYALGPTPVVRIALQLASPRAVTLSGDASGIVVTVAAQNDPGGARAGSGTFGANGLVAAAGPAPQSPGEQSAAAVDPGAGSTGAGDPNASGPVAAVPGGVGAGLAAGAQLGGAGGIVAGAPAPGGQGWKYGAPAPAAPGINPRLIVIDPGHGGSDYGSMHNGLVEKTLTLDMSKRLRDVLIARGWQVKMTRDNDRDVYQPNDSAHDELQARVDVANNAGARLFVSIHVNAFTDASQSGTTTYYYKASDLPFARAIHRSLLAASLGTADDGVVKANYYVIHHADAPATLVETAFDSNPSDAALLANPAWRQKIARAIADGIVEYLTNGAPQVDDGT